MPEISCPVPWFEQETGYFCGPAVAQMLLASLGAAPPAGPESWQQQLWKRIQQRTKKKRPKKATTEPSFPGQFCEKVGTEWSCWATAPWALRATLNLDQSAARFAVRRYSSEGRATEALRKALDAGSPAAVLIHGMQHWVAVDGVDYELPAAGPVAKPTITSVSLRDPLVAAAHEVEWDEWAGDYLSVVPIGQYKNRYVVVLGKRKGPVQAAPLAAAAVVVLPPPPGKAAVPSGAALRKMALAQARAKAGRGLARWQYAARQTVRARAPLVVQRLDRKQEYAIVPIRADGKEHARLLLDRAMGRLRSSALADPGTALPPFVDPTLAAARWDGTLEPPATERISVRRVTLRRRPTLVWKPCLESSSPLLPFYQFTAGRRTVYLRVDGRWFGELTTGMA